MVKKTAITTEPQLSLISVAMQNLHDPLVCYPRVVATTETEHRSLQVPIFEG